MTKYAGYEVKPHVHGAGCPKAGQFVVVLVDGYYEVQDTNNGNKYCFRSPNKAAADGMARHLEPRLGGKRLA